MDPKLTPKQAAFCNAYLECGNASEAYRRAYQADKMLPATVHRKAAELMENGKIAAMVEAMRQPAVDAAKVTLEGHLKTLAELRDEARGSGNLSSAIAAEKCRGQAAGFYAGGGVQVAVVNQITNVQEALDADLVRMVFEALTTDELVQECLKRGLRLLPTGEYEQEIKALFLEL